MYFEYPDVAGAIAGLNDISSRLSGIATNAVEQMATAAADTMLAGGASFVEVSLSHVTSVVHVGTVGTNAWGGFGGEGPAGEGPGGLNCRWWRKPGCYEQVVRSRGKWKPFALGTIHGPFFRVCHPYPKHWVCDFVDETVPLMEEIAIGISAAVDP